MRSARRYAGFRLQRGNDVQVEPVGEVAETSMVGSEPESSQGLTTQLPVVDRNCPAIQKLLESRRVFTGIGGVDNGQSFSQILANTGNVVGVQVNMRIALRVNVTLRSINRLWDLQLTHVICCHEVTGLADLDIRVSGPSQE